LEAALHAGVETELAGAVERVAAGITEGAGRRGGKGRGVEETGAGVERLAGEFGAHAGEAGAGEHAKGGRGEGQAAAGGDLGGEGPAFIERALPAAEQRPAFDADTGRVLGGGGEQVALVEAGASALGIE